MGDSMKHMHKISEFAQGGSSVEVGAIGMYSDSNGNASAEVAFWNAKELSVELELARLGCLFVNDLALSPYQA